MKGHGEEGGDKKKGSNCSKAKHNRLHVRNKKGEKVQMYIKMKVKRERKKG